ncbi:hypothetical protein HMPREF1985_01655 [Mitsuokella sp. oral taxon 131 str. W9106]|nr:hypothetical protein HMPREF1985_01655 [Mitsuokella sp. oral taxon 131 str. W9106]
MHAELEVTADAEHVALKSCIALHVQLVAEDFLRDEERDGFRLHGCAVADMDAFCVELDLPEWAVVEKDGLLWQGEDGEASRKIIRVTLYALTHHIPLVNVPIFSRAVDIRKMLRSGNAYPARLLVRLQAKMIAGHARTSRRFAEIDFGTFSRFSKPKVQGAKATGRFLFLNAR